MAQVLRRVADIRDGDEIVLPSLLPEEGDDIALVQEKVVQEDGRVTLLLNLPADAAFNTNPRPSELDGSPFEEIADRITEQESKNAG